MAIHGYHPYAEDGGLYLAGVEKLLHPELFPHSSEFVLAPTRFSAFAPLVAEIARLTRLTNGAGFAALIMLLHLATVWATLYTSYILACRCWTSLEARGGALLLLVCWLALPVAGTSLLFMDPYLTARSFSTPCTIAAVVGVVDAAAFFKLGFPANAHRRILLGAGSLALAALLHPLMAIYGLLATLLVAAFLLPWRGIRLAAALSVCGVFLGGYATIALLAPPETPDYITIALTRSYWFVSQWRWYEHAGIIAPLAILLGFALPRDQPQAQEDRMSLPPRRALAVAACVCAVLVTTIALLFAAGGAHTHLVAALQPLRGLQFVYLAMMLHLGATLGERLLRRNKLAWLSAIAVLGGPLFAAAQASTANSAHVELPGVSSPNAWVEAFVWARDNTPSDALFALPPDYISEEGEDAQCFRAIAQRSALADRSKDGGEAAVSPALTPLWAEGQAAQAQLSSESDAARTAKLKPLGVTWLVLPARSETTLDCPYRNDSAKVCRLP